MADMEMETNKNAKIVSMFTSINFQCFKYNGSKTDHNLFLSVPVAIFVF